MRRLISRIVIIGLIALTLAVVGLTIEAWPALGGKVTGERLDRAQRSPQYDVDSFENVLPQQDQMAFLTAMWRFFSDDTPYKEPEGPLAIVARSAQDFATLRDSLRVTWLGHSTMLIELDSTNILIDPVWGERVSPSRFVGARRFAPPPLAPEDLPHLDAVLISHDHYDHLDMPTVLRLRDKIPVWVVPLGVGAHLEHWGIDPDAIIELDWWDVTNIGGLDVVSTPARHFSGRALTDASATLWTGWAILGQDQRVFYSGDTGLTPSFADVGRRFGPFDLTLLETGAYNPGWSDIHLGPEQAFAVHHMVRGRVLMPVHWGMFNLAMHGWTEPGERILAVAESLAIPVALPRPGESVTVNEFPTGRWWPDRPWQTANEVPAISSNLPDSVLALIP